MEISTIRFCCTVCTLILLGSHSLHSCNGRSQLRISPLHPYDEVYRFDSSDCHRRLIYFTVNRDIDKVRDTAEIRSILETIFRKIAIKKNQSYCEFGILLFKETSELNSRFVSSNKRHPEQYSKCLLAQARWVNGEFVGYIFYRNGQIVNDGGDLQLVPIE